MVFPDSTDPVTLRALENRLAGQDQVDLVQLDVEWVRRLHALIELGERLISALTLALAAAVVLVVVNTIRLGIVPAGTDLSTRVGRDHLRPTLRIAPVEPGW